MDRDSCDVIPMVASIPIFCIILNTLFEDGKDISFWRCLYIFYFLFFIFLFFYLFFKFFFLLSGVCKEKLWHPIQKEVEHEQ